MRLVKRCWDVVGCVATQWEALTQFPFLIGAQANPVAKALGFSGLGWVFV